MENRKQHGDEWRWGLGNARNGSRTTLSVIEDVKSGNRPFGFARELQDEPSVDADAWALACNGVDPEDECSST